ncbi:M9 family metallopeptidase [Pelagibaculum spongiae]|nr:M9 family metallopeptidase [Pelagibaculum spongiae]
MRKLLIPIVLTSLLASGVNAQPIEAGHPEPFNLEEKPPIKLLLKNPQQPSFLVNPVQQSNILQQITPQALQLNSAQAVASCNSDDFASRSGSDLTDFIRQAPIDCVNDLFSLSGMMAYQVFRESQMVSVANSMAQQSLSYQGNNDQGIEQLVLFLRAGYYVQFYKADDVGQYGGNLKNSIRQALDNYFASDSYPLVNDDHGNVLREAIILIDSSGENARYLFIVKDMLARFNQQFADSWYMRAATNSVFTVLFRGHYNDDFKTKIFSDQSVINSLQQFIATHNNMIGSDGEFLLNNAARELGRFLKHYQLKSMLRPMVKSLLDNYSFANGPGIWVGAAEMADYYDSSQCNYYGVCNFKQQLAAQILPINHSCSNSVVIRAQQMTSQQLSDSCDELVAQGDYFHNKLQTGQQPVAGDMNSSLEVVVFNSADDYQTYSGTLFGNYTNNGGIYLEGTPSDANNQARFIAYEATWLPDFQVWNLRHEYVHYLDGRFNMKGGFSDYLTADTIWWLEGLGEYIDKKNFNDTAIDLARTREFGLSSIFKNDYNSDSDRVYRWGYLAVRFMFERHPDVVNQILGYFRNGDYAGYNNYLNARLTNYDSEWMDWLLEVESTVGDGSDNNGENPAIEVLNDGDMRVISSASSLELPEFKVVVPQGTQQLVIHIESGTGDADLYLRHNAQVTVDQWDYRPWINGNNETITVDNPAAGEWFIMVAPYNPFTNVQLSVSLTKDDNGGGDNNGGDDPLAELPNVCATQDSKTFIPKLQNEQDMAACVAGNQIVYGYFFVPMGVDKVTIKIGHGSGNAGFYYKDQSYPSTANYDEHMNVGGANEEVILNDPSNYRYHYFLFTAGHQNTSIQIIME